MTEIKVLIYSGPGVGTEGLPGTEKALDQATIPSYTFKHSRTTVINDSTVQGYDVVILPGGDGARKMYLNNPHINPETLKNIATVGICSGAYIQAKEVIEQDGTLMYTAYGVAPHTTAINYPHEGPVKVRFTEDAETQFGKQGTITMAHYNGPAFRLTSGVPLAYYVGGTMDGKPAIVMDGDGKHNHVLSGPHEELTPFYPDILANMVVSAYLGNKEENGGNKMNIKIDEIAEASDRVATFIKKNGRLPNTVNFNGNYIAMEDFLYLMVSAVININNNKSDDITFKDIGTAKNPLADYTPGKQLTKTEYVTVAQNIQNFINNNNRAPSYATTSIGKLATNDLVFDYSLIMAFYRANNRLPYTVTINQIKSSGGSTGGSIQKMIQDGTGITFNSITEFYNKIIVPYVCYSSPMYFDDIKTLRQEINVIINNVNGIYEGNSNQLNCCDAAAVTVALAREMGYQAYLYGLRCPADEINHAVALVSGKEFDGHSVWIRDKQYGPVVEHSGIIVDSAAGACDRYALGNYWCSLTDVLTCKEPGWLRYETLRTKNNRRIRQLR